MNLTDEQKQDASERIKKVEQFMQDNEVDITAYPQFIHMANGVYGIQSMCQFMDTKYAPKPEGIPSPFIKS